ncbi:hypothetical protein HZB69_00275 [Candidatus Amesbacteria bacterium]|nr:hypothetical protein [Candidatus Amesbacteria bacterium]
MIYYDVAKNGQTQKFPSTIARSGEAKDLIKPVHPKGVWFIAQNIATICKLRLDEATMLYYEALTDHMKKAEEERGTRNIEGES